MSLLSTFYNDPFFSGVNLPQALALEHRPRYDNHDRHITKHRKNTNQDINIFNNPFGFMQNMMGQMMNQMETTMNSNNFHEQDGQGISFSSSTVMSMDRRNGGEPRIFQATSEKLRGPEGLERTRKAVRDTNRHLEKMEIAHRLGERGHRITKERDSTSGQVLENREFEHIEDEHEFQREWFNRAEQLGLKSLHGNNGFDSHRNSLLMTPPDFQRIRSQSQEPRRLAIEQRQSDNSNSRGKGRRKK